MKYVAEQNNMIFNKDVKMLSQGPIDRFYDYLKIYPNTTLYAVVFCTTEWEIGNNMTLPCRYEKTDKRLIFYSIFFNVTLEDSNFLRTV
jgi:hypothetical protein